MPEVLAVLVVAAAGFVGYQIAPAAIAGWAIPPYAAALVLGPSLVYPRLRRRGQPTRRAVGASLLVPLLWLVKECWRVSAVHGFAESLYYALNPLAVGLFVGAALQMAIAELWLRRAETGAPRRGAWPVAVLAGVGALGAAFAWVAVRDGPNVVFYAYIALYRWLFGD